MPKYKLVTKKKANDISGFITFIYLFIKKN